jgi:hypothetical protein
LIRRLATAVTVGTLLAPLLPGVAVAAEYEMPTVVRYLVDPAAAQIGVSVEVTFTNTLPDPPGKISAFDRIELAIHDGASGVAASDGVGALHVDVETRDGVRVASVKPRARVRYNKSVSFTLSYELADGASPDLHVRSGIVKFQAWGFGTSSQVTVQLPSGYESRADGDPMITEEAEAGQTLTSGPIADPATWLALITAVQPGDLVTESATVALASGTVDLQVRAWTTDAAWGHATLSLLVKALPMLEEAIGLPYPRVGPLVVSEAVGGGEGADTPPSTTAEIQVAFDASAFTLLHQAAHVWIDDHLAADRWIREGLASHYAAGVALRLAVDPPYDPAVRASDLSADAFPLIEWRETGGASPTDAYGYAASWALIDRIAASVGDAHLTMALRRIVAGVPAYDPVDPDAADVADPRFAPVETRRLLDQLAAVSGADLANLFGQAAFGTDAALELAQREAARDAYAHLLSAAGDWGAPDPVRSAMGGWRFDEARAGIDAASAWLEARDDLVAQIAAAELATPQRLRDRYTVAGGGADASAELDAERAIVERYLGLKDRIEGPLDPLQAVGLFMASDPGETLAEAASEFGTGDLQSAAAALDRLELRLNRAPSDGAVRLASAAVLVALLGLGAGAALRRRAGSHYTAAP